MAPVDLTGQVHTRDKRPSFIGNYSFVYRGVYNHRDVAVKVLKDANNRSLKAMRRKVNRERVVWAALDHPNILQFYGFAEDPEFGPFGALISPWCEYGDTNSFFAHYGDRVPTSQRIELWKDTIAGVDYLHSFRPTIIHGDIKPGNILINDSIRAVLCDFGLVSIFLDEGSSGMTTTTAHTGMERYLAPELVTGDDDMEYPTIASDVYAVGCIGLELVFGQKVYAHRKHNIRGCLIDDIASGMPPSEMPEDISEETLTCWDLIEACWNPDPSQRPPSERLLVKIDDISAIKTQASHVITTKDASVEDSEEEELELGAGSTPKAPEILTGHVTVDMSEPKFKGNYSWVFQGTYKGGKVAVKIIKEVGKPESMNKKVKRETVIWANTDHRNIHVFYGIAEDEIFSPYGALISPWCDNGDAAQFLRKNKSTSFTERIKLWKGVIDGVAYLHGRKLKIVHGDLKPGNVLIDDAGVPKICDFGLARIFLEEENNTMTTTEHTGTERYLAPELVAGKVDAYPTTASDVYALGCLGLEIVLGQTPFCHRKSNLQGRIISDIKSGVPPAVECPVQHQPIEVWPILQQLWAAKPTARPSALTAASIVEAIFPA